MTTESDILRLFVDNFNNKGRIILMSIWNDPVLTLVGEDWTFNTMSSWRITKNDCFLGGFNEKNSDFLISDLTGQSISAGIADSRFEPQFFLGNGAVLQIFVTTFFEPWVYRDSDITLVESDPSML